VSDCWLNVLTECIVVFISKTSSVLISLDLLDISVSSNFKIKIPVLGLLGVFLVQVVVLFQDTIKRQKAVVKNLIGYYFLRLWL